MKIDNYTRIFAVCTALIGPGAFAQTIDVDQVNQNSTRMIEENDPKVFDHLWKGLKYVGKQVALGLLPPKQQLPRDRKLSESDGPKKDLLRCVEKVLQNNQGALQAPQIAYQMLGRAMDQNGWVSDSAVIENAASQCRSERAQIRAYPDRKINEDQLKAAIVALPVENAAQLKMKNLIEVLSFPNASQCQVSNLKVAAGVLIIGIEGGLKKLKCVYSNGMVASFVGPSIGIQSPALGATISWRTIAVQQDDGDVEATRFPSIHSPLHIRTEQEGDWPNETFTVLGIGSVHATDIDYQRGRSPHEAYQGLAVGLGLPQDPFPTVAIGFLIRGFNGKRHWGMLIDQLN